MKTGKLVLAGIASVMLASAAAIPSLAQQATGNANPDPNGRAGAIMKMFDADNNGQITRDEANAEKAKIFAEIDKNGDKKLSYDEVKAWAQDMLRKMPAPPPGEQAGNPPPPPAQADGQDNPAPDAQNQARGPGAMMADGQGRPRWAMGRDGGPRGDWGGPGTMRHGMMHGGFGGHGEHHGFDGPRPDARMRLAMMFVHADANDDGFISQEEFNVMTDQMFTRFDRNDDGVIDRQDMPRHDPRADGWRGRGPMNWPDKN